MKKFTFILFLLLGATILSCEQEDFSSPTGLEGLRDFKLTAIPGAKIALNSLQPDADVVFSWEAPKSGFNSPVTYTWMLDEAGGDFSSPLLSLESDETGTVPSFTRTNEELEEILEDAGVAAGAELEAVWTVKATNGEVTKTAPAQAVTLMRYSEAIMTFDLRGPNDGSVIFLKDATPTANIVIEWDSTFSGLGTAVKYDFLVDETDGDFSTPLLTIPADNNGGENSVTLTHAQWEQHLITLGTDAQSLKAFSWTVRATAGTKTQLANEANDLKMVRFGTEVTFRIPALPAVSPAGKDVFIAGGLGFLGLDYADWQTPGSNPLLKLTKDVDNSYFIVLNVPKGYSFEYKFALATTADPTWSNGEQKVNGGGNGCEGISNRSFTFNGTNDIVSHTVGTWEGFCPFDVVDFTFVLEQYAAIPAGYDVYMAGEFSNLGVAAGNWQQPGTNADLKLTLDPSDNKYKKTFTVSKSKNGTAFNYKYFLVPTGGSSWDNGEQKFNLSGGFCTGDGTDRSYTFTLTEAQTAARVQSWQNFCPNFVTFRVTVPNNTPADKDVFLAGSWGFIGGTFGDWQQPGTNAALKLTKDADGTYYIKLPIKSGQSVNYKFFLATTASPNWGNGEQKINASNTGCEGIGDRSYTFTGTDTEQAHTVISWEGFCPI